MPMTRRDWMKAIALAGAVPARVFAEGAPIPGKPRVVIVGGGFGGATAAKYLRLWAPSIEVVLVERNEAFVSCPMSNLVLGGLKSIEDLTTSYGVLSERYGFTIVRDEATAIDPERRRVKLKRGDPLSYDRLIVSPGVDFVYDDIGGLDGDEARTRVLHAWKAGAQTVALRKQLEALPDGGVFVISIPKAPYRCPPGPYERASIVADYFKRVKPRSKVLVFDANPEIVSKKALFTKAWSDLYPQHLEYRPNSEIVSVDAGALTARFQFDEAKADVLNVIPPQRAADIAALAGLITVNKQWCGVDFLTFESKAVPGVHILGDAISAAPAMPKSAFMANNQAKVAVGAVIALLAGRDPDPEPVLANTCYSFVSDRRVIHVASVHKYDAEKKTFLTVPGSGGVSTGPSEIEAGYAEAWARNIWADTLL